MAGNGIIDRKHDNLRFMPAEFPPRTKATAEPRFVSGLRFKSRAGETFLAATVHIVDDDPSFRTSTGRLLQACGYAVALYESGEALLAQLPKDAGASCILLDIMIPALSGPELQARLNGMGSHLPIVFLTGHGDISTAVQVIKAGAEDLLTKPVTKDRLLAAIEQAIARGRVRQEEDDKLEGLRRLASGLTPRERQVFDRVARGGLNKQIAYELGTTERTIKAHRHNLMEKLWVGSLAELVLMAERLGMLAQAASLNEQRATEAKESPAS
jgi:FixJ family two-component response regulator